MEIVGYVRVIDILYALVSREVSKVPRVREVVKKCYM